MRELIPLVIIGSLLFICISATGQTVLFNKFISKFPKEKVAFALDENFMVNQIERDEYCEKIDPIFYEFIFDEKIKEEVFRKCGGYFGVDSCLAICYIAKLDMSPSYHSVVFSEKIMEADQQLIKYHLVTFTLKGEMISTVEIARMKYQAGVVNVWEGYIFADDNIFRILKSYERPEDLLTLSKQRYKLNGKGKISQL